LSRLNRLADGNDGTYVIAFTAKVSALADFDDAGHFYDGGFFLPLGKCGGLLMIRVHASESLTVIVEQSHLPMMVFSPCVFSE
jgi:hypothetical protein